MTAVEFFLMIIGTGVGLIVFSLWLARIVTEWWIDE